VHHAEEIVADLQHVAAGGCASFGQVVVALPGIVLIRRVAGECGAFHFGQRLYGALELVVGGPVVLDAGRIGYLDVDRPDRRVVESDGLLVKLVETASGGRDREHDHEREPDLQAQHQVPGLAPPDRLEQMGKHQAFSFGARTGCTRETFQSGR
jgi:hypothetical protein